MMRRLDSGGLEFNNVFVELETTVIFRNKRIKTVVINHNCKKLESENL